MNFKLLKTIVISLILSTCGFSVQAGYQAYQVEAVYIFRIANFIQWESNNKTTLVFCGLKNDLVIQTLEKISVDKIIQGKRVIVNTDNNTNKCDIYVASKITSDETLNKLDKNVLTISGLKNFSKRNGMIELRKVEGKVKPAINLDNLQHSSFKVSSQLLRLAIIERSEQG
ncbi:YfiR family protein [Aliivibrio fischeri]|uniref:YfiR family protein n=1 Tax=Aliivibrio fischeri TaxID=668 RepID=UPI0037359E36